MDRETTTRVRRVDARRNRDRLIAAADELFTTDGPDVPLEAIARRAGVGVGTFYRHFASREVLVEAVFSQRVQTLCAGALLLLATRPPIDALRSFLQRLVGFAAETQGIMPAIQALLTTESPVFDQGRDQMTEAISGLLQAGAEQSALRDDVDARDVMRLMGSVCVGPGTPGWHERSTRLVDLIVDGLRYPAVAGRP